jgi:hypothetical protein
MDIKQQLNRIEKNQKLILERMNPLIELSEILLLAKIETQKGAAEKKAVPGKRKRTSIKQTKEHYKKLFSGQNKK